MHEKNIRAKNIVRRRVKRKGELRENYEYDEGIELKVTEMWKRTKKKRKKLRTSI